MKAITTLFIAILLLHLPVAWSVEFESSTATFAAWNLEGRFPIPATRLAKQAEGIALLDAEVLALVEINPDGAMDDLKTLLQDDFDLCYDFEILPQTSIQNIAVMAKCGIPITNPRFIGNSDIGDSSLRKAFVALACPVIIGPLMLLGFLDSGGTDERQAI